MKKNPLLDSLRKGMTDDTKKEIDLSFDIANRIHDILVEKGMTQREFAKKLGKSETEISKWLRGTHNFTFKTLVKIEIALGEPVIQVTGKSKDSQQINFIGSSFRKQNAHIYHRR